MTKKQALFPEKLSLEVYLGFYHIQAALTDKKAFIYNEFKDYFHKAF